MKTPDLFLNSPIINSDPNATRELAAYTAKLVDILRDIYDHLGRIKIVTVAPTAKELDEFMNESDVVIFHAASSSDRKFYYKKSGTVYSINSS